MAGHTYRAVVGGGSDEVKVGGGALGSLCKHHRASEARVAVGEEACGCVVANGSDATQGVASTALVSIEAGAGANGGVTGATAAALVELANGGLEDRVEHLVRAGVHVDGPVRALHVVKQCHTWWSAVQVGSILATLTAVWPTMFAHASCTPSAPSPPTGAAEVAMVSVVQEPLSFFQRYVLGLAVASSTSMVKTASEAPL